jgi:hypothetical protein
MKYLKELIVIANKLDSKGLTEEASLLDGLITRASKKRAQAPYYWPEDEEGPSDTELRSMELGLYDPVGEDVKESLYERLSRVRREMEVFGIAISDGEMTEEDWATYLEIQKDLSEVLREMGKSDMEASEESLFE